MNAQVMSMAWLQLRRSWDKVSVYVPIMLMALLASASYWLVRNAPSLSSDEVQSAPRHVPDYFMRDFAVRVYDVDGKLKSEVLGVQGKHFPDTDTFEVEQPRVKVFSKKGQLTIATAERGLVNGDGTEIELFDHAVITRDPLEQEGQKQQISSAFLHLFSDTEVIRTHLPVEIIRGKNDHFTADSMDYDNLGRVMKLHGRVRGVLMPAKKAP